VTQGNGAFEVEVESPKDTVPELSESQGPVETLNIPKAVNKIKFSVEPGVDFQDDKRSVSLESFQCPKCSETYNGGQKECHRCGVVFKKLESESAIKVEASEFLRALWERVIVDYDNLVRHEGFLRACYEELNLAYAAYRYGKIVKAYSGDSIAQKMLRQIEELTSVQMGMGNSRVIAKRRFGWLMFILFIGVTMIGVGFGIPQFRNMVGLGVATIFLALATKMYFK